MSNQPKTGPMRFGEGRPGVFIRGDDAAHFADCLATVMESVEGRDAEEPLRGLLRDLRSANARCFASLTQTMRNYDECREGCR